MHTIHKQIKPTSVAPAAPKLSPADQNRLAATLAELQRIDGVLVSIDGLREAVHAAAKNYARGIIPIEVAAGLACIEPARIPDARGALRHGAKELMREQIAAVSDIVDNHRQSIVADLAAKCATMEKTERANARNVGIDDDSYRPSGLLESLREQHRRAAGQVGVSITRADLNALANALGMPTIAAPEDDENFLGID
jgi:hypothetical protein